MTNAASLRVVASVSLALLLVVGVRVEAETVEAAYVPWSGWWWPQSTRVLATGAGYRGHPAPLEKLDVYTAGDTLDGAAAWEIANHNGTSSWEGHCNGWSTASILQYEPDEPGVIDGIPFSVGDKKGILTEAGFGGAYDWLLGNRYDGLAGDNADDPWPADFHQALQVFIGDLGQPVVFDVNRLQPVWNYPAHAYTTESRWDGSTEHVTTTVSFVDDDVLPDFVGSEIFTKTYTYDFVWSNGEIVESYWTGASVLDHPDFAWLPTGMGADNPFVDLEAAEEVAAAGDDDLEGNDTWVAASMIGDARHEGLACLDDDFFRVNLIAGQTLDVTLLFQNLYGDLDLEILDSAGVRLASASGASDYETCSVTTLAAAPYFIRVFGFEEAINGYALDVRILDPVAASDSSTVSLGSVTSSSGSVPKGGGGGACLLTRISTPPLVLVLLRQFRDLLLTSRVGAALCGAYYWLSTLMV